MILLDVASLFTNVSLAKSIHFLCGHIEDNQINVDIPKHYLKELLLRCTFNVQFKWNDELYRQVDDVAMGAFLDPLLADIFMADLKNTVF